MILGSPKRLRPRVIHSVAESLAVGQAARRTAVEQNRADREAYEADPLVAAVRRVRSALSSLADLGEIADREWRAANDPVPCPISGRSAFMHPQKARRLREFVESEGWGHEWTAPIASTETLDAIRVRVTAETQAELREAQRECAALEGKPWPDQAGTADEMPMLVDQVDAIAERGFVLDPVLDEHEPVLPTRRGPGRPPKAV